MWTEIKMSADKGG